MKVLFIGGTGNISTPVSLMALQTGIELWHLNRGRRPAVEGANVLHADLNDAKAVRAALSGHTWDAVVNWIAYTPDEVSRDIGLFTDQTAQYVFISSASAYHKPPAGGIITESTPLRNIHWQYSRDKIACEEILTAAWRNHGFPVTIVRPSHTYYSVIPVSLGGWEEFTVIDRIRKRMPIVVHGDGTSLWTMTHARDFGKGFLGLLGNPFAIGEAVHITSDEVLSWNRIYELVARAAGEEPLIVHLPSRFIADYADRHGYPSVRGTLLGDKSESALFDNTKIRRLVPGYRATIPFAEGIRETIAWFDADPARRTVSEETNQFLDGLFDAYRLLAEC